MINVICLDCGCDDQVKWRYQSKAGFVLYSCNEHCKISMSKINMNYNYDGELKMFTGNVPKKFQPNSHGALKPM